MFCFRDNGKMRFMKKLELSPSCIHPYGIIPPQAGTSNVRPLTLHPQHTHYTPTVTPHTLTTYPPLTPSHPHYIPTPHPSHPHTLTGEEGEGVLQYLLTSHTNQLMVFQDSSLVWAARLDHPPTDITVANFK